MLLSIYTIQAYRSSAGRALVVFFLLSGAWSLFAALIYQAPTLEEKIWLNRWKMFPPSLIPVVSVWVCVSLLGHWTWRWWKVALLLFIPLVSMGLLLFDSTHELVITDYRLLELAGGQALAFANGPWFFVHNWHARLIIIWALYLLSKSLFSTHPDFRIKAILIFVTILVPFVADSLAVFAWAELRYLQITPTLLAVSGVILVYAIFHHQVLDVIPLGRSFVLDQLPDPYFVYDSQERLIDYNRAAEIYLPPRWQRLGLDMGQLFEKHPELAEAFGSLRQEGGGARDLSTSKNGVFTHSRLELQVIRHPAGPRVGGILVLRDQTVSKRLEVDLRELNEMKGKFLGILAHDLIGNVKSLSLLASSVSSQAGSDREELRSTAKMIQKASDEIGEFVERLLLWSKSQMNLIRVRQDRIDLSETIRDVVEFLEAVIRSRGVHVEVIGPSGVVCLGDEEMLRTVLRNLLENAFRFTVAGKTVRIEWGTQDAEIYIRIRDEGPGISPEDIENLARLDIHGSQLMSSQSREMGMGLILCREFIRLQRGRLEIESRLGEGSVFTVRLPISQNASALADSEAPTFGSRPPPRVSVKD